MVVLFDGVCSLCNTAVDFILRHESGSELRFATLQSGLGAKLGQNCDQLGSEMDTVVLVERGVCYTRSAAVLRIANHLRWPWRLLTVLVILPRPLRDAIYDFIAIRRYAWFGKRSTCRIPTDAEKERFLE